ncbi:hypothetical protein C9374_008622 [Naegleria lovaniensis]|uniref:Major facilitator superfamily (MFS) profile domain-containing protein n=1 Tax=Naegleria lovaniensis TaxID=51637 RepID=A0AA88GJ38_NAELO|nr:uncharacterized protein C9374_008622 [Naegleria lovaniensis]KAG2378000.1 hypothetical protein C9374_008622 [Naegleria lovaniensis]
MKFKNPIKRFYKLSIVEKYESFVKSKRVFLAMCLVLTNLMGGLMYGYAQGTVGAALQSAISGLLMTNSATSNNNSTSLNQQFTTLDATTIKPNLKFTMENIHSFFPSVVQTFVENLSPAVVHAAGNNPSVPTSPFDLGNSLLQGLYASSIFIGGLIGAVFVILIGNYLGRKLCMILCCMIFSIGCIGASASNSYASLIVFRCIMGFGAAISTSVCSVYMAELMPFAKYQGVLGAMYNMGIASGSALGYAFGAIFLFTSEQWRAVHSLGNICSILLLTLVLIIPESPMFVESGSSMLDQSEIKAYESSGTSSIDPGVLKKERDMTSENQARNHSPTTTTASTITTTSLSSTSESLESGTLKSRMSFLAALRRLFCSKVVIAMFISSFYCFAIEWTGIQSATLFIPSLLESAGVKDGLAQQLVAFGVFVWEVITIIPFIFLVDRFGRKTILIFGFTVSTLTNLAEGFIFQFAPEGSTERIVLALVFIALYLIGFNIGIGSLTFILDHEVFNGEHEQVVVLGTSIATMVLWSFSIILALFFIPVIQVTSQAVPWFVFSGISFIGLLVTIFLLKETSPYVLSKRKQDETTASSSTTTSLSPQKSETTSETKSSIEMNDVREVVVAVVSASAAMVEPQAQVAAACQCNPNAVADSAPTQLPKQ